MKNEISSENELYNASTCKRLICTGAARQILAVNAIHSFRLYVDPTPTYSFQHFPPISTMWPFLAFSCQMKNANIKHSIYTVNS